MSGNTPSAPRPPQAPVKPTKFETHGDKRVDDYYWLREKSNPEVIRYLEAENAYTAEMLKHTEELQEKLYQEILGRIRETDLHVPVRIGGYYYYTRTEEGRQYSIHCRKQGNLDADEEVLPFHEFQQILACVRRLFPNAAPYDRGERLPRAPLGFSQYFVGVECKRDSLGGNA